MENIVQAMMSNPEIAQLMQQPGMLEKMQQLQSNPMEAMNDPDVMRLITALQSSGSMNDLMTMAQNGQMPSPSSFGGGGSQPYAGYGSPTSSPPPTGGSPGGKVHEITSSQQFNTLLQQGTQSTIPVIVDFTAAWCGPCKVFAPKFAEMAQNYGSTALFLKVDGDKNRDLIETYSVTAYPTIMTFVDGKTADTITGADVAAVQRAISSALSTCEYLRQQQSLSRFKHFPIQETECVYYRTVAWDKVKQKLSSVLVEGCDAEFYHGYPSPVQMLPDALELCNFLEKYKQNSMTPMPKAQTQALDALLAWPEQHYATPLHLLRIALFHADTARLFATEGLCKGSADNVLQRVSQHVQQTEANMVAVLALRALASAFEKRSIARVALQSCESLLELITVFMLTFGDDQHVKSSAMSLLLNLSYIISDFATAMDVFPAIKAIIPCLLETLPLADPDQQTLYKMLVCVGTVLLVKTKGDITTILNDVNAKQSLDDWKAEHPNNENLQQIIKEITSLL